MPALTDLTILEASRLLAAGEISSLELATACLERIDALEPSLQAYITLTPHLALDMARQADRRLQDARRSQGNPESPLLGIPLAVKDVFCLEGVPCTCGSRILEGFIPPYTATALQRLVSAGMVITGKTNTDEYAMGSSTENSAYKTTRNPWNLERVPGGSSGGSAAAVAARLVPAAIGSDTGGSIRQPASFCGVTGIKPTYGRVSRQGLVAYGSSLDCVGAIARSAGDAALLYSAMAGRDPLDATTSDRPVEAAPFQQEPSLAGLRLGVPREYFIEGMQAGVESAVREAVAVFERLGVEIRPVSLPHTSYALPVYYIIAPAEASANLARYDGVRYGPRLSDDSIQEMYCQTRGRLFGQEVKRRIMLGTYALSAGYYDAYYGQAQKVRTLIRQDFERTFEQVDAIAAPVAPSTAFGIGQHGDDPLSMYLEDVFTLPANLAGVPGLAFPAGFDQDGLPVGIQLMGPAFEEGRLFRMAHAYQQVTGWHTRKPDLDG